MSTGWSTHFKGYYYCFERTVHADTWQVIKTDLPMFKAFVASEKPKLLGNYVYYIFSQAVYDGNRDISFSLVYLDAYPTNEELQSDIANFKAKYRIQEVNKMNGLVFVRNGKALTTSREVARAFSKRHDDVLKAIKNLECSQEFRLRNFAESSYINEQNRRMPMYEIVKDGFMFLVMGFKGEKAAQWKEAFIKAFNEMEEELQRLHSNPVAPDLSNIKILQAIVNKMANIDDRVKAIESCYKYV